MPGLCYVGRVQKLAPIDGADRIELAEVVCGDGGKWCGVVGKGDFQVGDHCETYLQDAIVKPCEDLKFLEKSNWRVRMQRFRGAPSECVIVQQREVRAGHDVGFDLTEERGVTKYVKEVPGAMLSPEGGSWRSWPAFIPKTDEPNFQTAGRLVEALRGKPWYATLKYDGSSCTAYRRGEHFGVCSRNLELEEWADNAFWKVALRYGLKETLPDGYALQFELIGPGVQKNPLGLSELDGRAFNAYKFDEGRYLGCDEFFGFCQKVGFWPVLDVATGDSFDMTDEELRKLAEVTYPNKKPGEGIVIRPQTEEFVPRAGRLSFKVINLLYKEG